MNFFLSHIFCCPLHSPLFSLLKKYVCFCCFSTTKDGIFNFASFCFGGYGKGRFGTRCDRHASRLRNGLADLDLGPMAGDPLECDYVWLVSWLISETRGGRDLSGTLGRLIGRLGEVYRGLGESLF